MCEGAGRCGALGGDLIMARLIIPIPGPPLKYTAPTHRSIFSPWRLYTDPQGYGVHLHVHTTHRRCMLQWRPLLLVSV